MGACVFAASLAVLELPGKQETLSIVAVADGNCKTLSPLTEERVTEL